MNIITSDTEHPALGAKASNLALFSKSLSVPESTVIAADLFRAFLADAGLRTALEDVLHRFVNGSIDATTASRQVGNVVAAAPLPSALTASLNAITPRASTMAVRSSANVEDSPTRSFAGLFESCLNISRETLPDAIKRVWASTFSPRALDYCKAHHIDPTTIEMAVLVQQMVPGQKFGVAFAFDTASLGRVTIAEATVNSPDAITSGQGGWDQYVLYQEQIRKSPAVYDRNTLFGFEVSAIQHLASVVGKSIYPLDIE